MSYYKLRQIYFKLKENIITNYDSTLLQITIAFCRLRQNVSTNYGSFITNYDNVLLQITAALSNYYKLRQLLVLLQIT